MDMDGVLVHEEHIIPCADAFLTELQEAGTPFIVLTNNSIRTPRDLRARLLRSGLDIPEKSIWTSALATATFLKNQRPGGSAYVVGESGLTTALHEIGYVLTDNDPDYVVLGETRTYSSRRSRPRSGSSSEARGSSPPTPTPPARPARVPSPQQVRSRR